MATALQGALLRTTLGCIVVAVASCHGASKGDVVSPTLGASTPAAMTASVPPVERVMENDFAGEGEMQDEAEPYVVSMQAPTLDSASSDRDALDDCKVWALTSGEAEALFAMSHSIDAHTWNEEHDAPCAITGTVHSDGMDWEFSINGASKAIWRSGESVRYLSCDSRECEQFSS